MGIGGVEVGEVVGKRGKKFGRFLCTPSQDGFGRP